MKPVRNQPLPAQIKPQDYLCFVVKSVLPYSYDLVSLLGQQEGHLFSHRYRKAQIESSVHRDLLSLQSLPTLTLYYDQASQTLTPIRKGKVASTTTFGDICFFQYALGELVILQKDGGPDPAVKPFVEAFLQQHPELKQASGSDLCVFRSELPHSLRSCPFNSPDEWATMVGSLGPLDPSRIVNVMVPLSVRPMGTSKDIPTRDSRLRVQPGQQYEFVVFQRQTQLDKDPVAGQIIELKSFSDEVSIVKGVSPLRGKYDFHSFVFRVPHWARRSNAFLQLSISSADTRDQLSLSPILIELEVSPKTFVKAIRVFLLVLGLLLSFSQLTMTPFHEYLSTAVISLLSTLGLVIFIIGMTGISAVRQLLDSVFGKQ